MRADHPRIGDTLTRKHFLEASHALVASIGAGHRVIEEALERAGLARRIALRVPHFTVVPMILERTDLIVTAAVTGRARLRATGRFKSLKPPVQIPPADVRVHWHERFDKDVANRWLRELVVELYAE